MNQPWDTDDPAQSASHDLRVPDSIPSRRVRDFDIEPLAFDLASFPELQAVHARWDAWRAGRPAPAWGDVVLMEFPAQALPYVIVLDVVDDDPAALDFRFRYWGSGCAALFAVECTKALLSAIAMWPKFKAAVFEQLVTVQRLQKPTFHRFRFDLDTDANVSVYVLRLPLMDEAGRVTKIIAVHDPYHPGMHPIELAGLLAMLGDTAPGDAND